MISLRRKHPRYERLSQLADSELSAAEAMEVNAHLAVCDDCRAEVDFMLELRERLTELSGPPIPQTLLPEILSLRAMGDRVILDHGEFEEPKRQRSKVQMAAGPGAAALLLAGAFTFFGVNRADAGANSFEVGLDAVGVPEMLTFSTAGTLASEAVVRARGAYFEPLDYVWDELTPLAFERQLPRRRAGEYSESISFPTEAAYASIAVEDLAGRVQEGGPAPWGFLPPGSEGKPAFDGLLIQGRLELDAGRLNSAIQTANTLTNLYPDRVAAWSLLHSAENDLGELSESRKAQHAERLATYAEGILSGSVPTNANHIATVAFYAKSQGDLTTYRVLLERLREAAPGHPLALGDELGRTASNLRTAPERLSALEKAWDDFGAFPSSLLGLVVSSLRAADEAAAAHRWAARWVAAYPHKRFEAARNLTGLRSPTADVVETLARAIAELEAGEMPRPVGVSRDAFAAEERIQIQLLSKWLGRYQIQLGAVEEGYARLLIAAETGWDTELFLEVAAHALARGDRQRAIEYLILADQDPLADPSNAAARAQLDALGLTPEDIRAFREDYSAEVERRIYFGQVASPPANGELRLEALGDTRPSLDLASGAVSIVEFWTPQLRPTESSLSPHCAKLDAAEVRVLRMTTDFPGATGDSVDIPCSAGSYYDRHGDTQQALGRSYLKEVVVVDRQGQVRFRSTRPDDAVRAALYLGLPNH